jgi:hypothetical protein
MRYNYNLNEIEKFIKILQMICVIALFGTSELIPRNIEKAKCPKREN